MANDILIKNSGPILRVQDILKSTDFFVNKLGFTIAFLYSSEISPTYAAVKRGTAEIHLAADGKPKTGARVFIWLDSGIEKINEQIKQAGVDVDEPIKEEWGGKLFQVTDPDGNEIQFLMNVIQ